MSVISWFIGRLNQRRKKKRTLEYSKHLTQARIDELQKLIGVQLKDKSLYIQALIHRSFLEQNDEFEISNERLEFLGDAVLNLVVAQFLYDTFPDQDEGFLTKTRARIVNRLSLAEAAEEMNLGKYLLISRNLQNTFANGSKTVLSDALEAVIGAVYMDAGLKDANNFILNHIVEPIISDGDYLIDENFKSQLLEYAQANRMENPSYEVIKEEGPQHARVFTVKVKIGDTGYGKGVGKNKKSAEQNAAKNALKKLGNTTE